MAHTFLDTLFEIFGLGTKQGPVEMTEVKTVHASDGVRRLRVFSRADGAFSYREDFYNTKGAEAYWEPLTSDYKGEFASAEEALAEAAGNIPWVAEAMRG